MLQDNSFQSSWAGLDSILIDEEFLYLDNEEADKIYKQLKQRQSRKRQMEETELRWSMRMRDLDAMAAGENAGSDADGNDENRIMQS